MHSSPQAVTWGVAAPVVRLARPRWLGRNSFIQATRSWSSSSAPPWLASSLPSPSPVGRDVGQFMMSDWRWRPATDCPRPRRRRFARGRKRMVVSATAVGAGRRCSRGCGSNSTCGSLDPAPAKDSAFSSGSSPASQRWRLRWASRSSPVMLTAARFTRSACATRGRPKLHPNMPPSSARGRSRMDAGFVTIAAASRFCTPSGTTITGPSLNSLASDRMARKAHRCALL
jgi:hypothetical protein